MDGTQETQQSSGHSPAKDLKHPFSIGESTSILNHCNRTRGRRNNKTELKYIICFSRMIPD